MSELRHYIVLHNWEYPPKTNLWEQVTVVEARSPLHAKKIVHGGTSSMEGSLIAIPLKYWRIMENHD